MLKAEMGNELGAVGLMVGEPLSQALGQKLEEFVVVLAGAAALPGRFGRRHFSQHSRTPGLVAGISQFEIRNSKLTKDFRPSLPARYAVFPEKRGVPGRIWVAHLEVKHAVQGRRKSPCLEPDLQRLEAEGLVGFFQEIPESLG